jgi:glycosyltransferase involved in cell wall biosynthesis
VRRRLLIIAFHFPPLQGSTGIYRTLGFAKYLPEHGWDVRVLTASATAYPEVRAENLSIVPPGTNVTRAWALDTQRHLAIAGRYPQLLATPDRWRSWIPFGFVAGLNLIRSWRPQAILSTYPIPSAHCIALALRRVCKVPWIADFRDPMLQENYPREPMLRRSYERIERATFKRADRITVTTPGTADLYRERYGAAAQSRIHVVPNGFDEDLFRSLADVTTTTAARASPRIKLLHSGLLYPHERNPENFFQALAELLAEGHLREDDVEVVLRASGNEAQYGKRIAELGLSRMIQLLPSIPYRDALTEMVSADACLLFQADNCNQQIPAKVYEYLYVGKPILALTDPRGDTGRLLASVGVPHVAALEDKAAIKRCLVEFLAALKNGQVPQVPRQIVMNYSRRAAAERLSTLLSELSGA